MLATRSGHRRPGGSRPQHVAAAKLSRQAALAMGSNPLGPALADLCPRFCSWKAELHARSAPHSAREDSASCTQEREDARRPAAADMGPRGLHVPSDASAQPIQGARRCCSRPAAVATAPSGRVLAALLACLCGLTVWYQQEQACSTDFVV